MRISDWSSDVCSSDLKASGVIGEAQADPTFAKLTANAFDQEQMFRNDLTSAQIQVGAMEGRRDYAGDNVAGVERDNVATEQGWRTGSDQGQREAASMLGLSGYETRSAAHTSELQSLRRISDNDHDLKNKTS